MFWNTFRGQGSDFSTWSGGWPRVSTRTRETIWRGLSCKIRGMNNPPFNQFLIGGWILMLNDVLVLCRWISMWRCFQKSLTAGLWNTGLKMKRLWRKQKRLIRTCWSGFRSMLSEIWNKVLQCFLRLEHEIYQLLLYPMVWFESVSISLLLKKKITSYVFVYQQND